MNNVVQIKQKAGTLFFRIAMLALTFVGVCGLLALGFLGYFNGASAYDVAVRNGFNGTEAQWVEALQGMPGQDSDTFIAAAEAAWIIAKEEGLIDDDITLLEFIEYIVENFKDELKGEKGDTGESTNMISASDKALLSSVSITSSAGSGSGVVYKINKTTGEAYILTNCHVVTTKNPSTNRAVMATNINVYFFGMQPNVDTTITSTPFRAYILGISPSHDLAILHISPGVISAEVLSIVQQVQIPNRLDPRMGEQVIAVGAPISIRYGISITDGIVSTYSEWISMPALDSSGDDYYRVFRTSAAVNSGNSGGGMFNSKGELLGIVMSKLSTVSGGAMVDNVGHAIPMDIVLRVARQFVNRSSEWNAQGGSISTRSPLRLIETKFGIQLDNKNVRIDVHPDGEVFLHADVTIGRFEATTFFNIRDYLNVNDIIRGVSFNTLNCSGNPELLEVDIYQSHHLIDALIGSHNHGVSNIVTFHVQKGGTGPVVAVPVSLAV